MLSENNYNELNFHDRNVIMGVICVFSGWNGSIIEGDEIQLKGSEEVFSGLQVPLNSGKKNVTYVNSNDSNLTIQTVAYENIVKNEKGVGSLDNIGDLPGELIIKSIKNQLEVIKNLDKEAKNIESQLPNSSEFESTTTPKQDDKQGETVNTDQSQIKTPEVQKLDEKIKDESETLLVSSEAQIKAEKTETPNSNKNSKEDLESKTIEGVKTDQDLKKEKLAIEKSYEKAILSKFDTQSVVILL